MAVFPTNCFVWYFVVATVLCTRGLFSGLQLLLGGSATQTSQPYPNTLVLSRTFIDGRTGVESNNVAKINATSLKRPAPQICSASIF